MERKEGYYWCKIDGYWEILEWYKGRFWRGHDSVLEQRIDLINESRILNPDGE
jgi:hypothetical protein